LLGNDELEGEVRLTTSIEYVSPEEVKREMEVAQELGEEEEEQ
jgi:hypothetical protein